MATIHLKGVGKSFSGQPPVQALSNVDLTVPSGCITAVLGPSGCGKTTLLRLIAGFERPDEGEIFFDDRPIAGRAMFVPPEERRFGIVPQEGALFPHLTVEQNVAFGLKQFGHLPVLKGSMTRRKRSMEMLELVGLPDLGKRWPSELSGGQQQRIALARALAPAPEVVLLDEPFSSIDTALRLELREEMRELLRRLGTTAILVTHDQGEALSLAERVAVMRQGRVVQSGPPEEVYALPADPETASFLGDAVLLPATLVKDEQRACWSADCALGRVSVRIANADIAAVPATCKVMVRPEQVRIGEGGVAATVLRVSYFGHDAVVSMSLGADGKGASVKARISPPAPRPGDIVGVQVEECLVVYL